MTLKNLQQLAEREKCIENAIKEWTPFQTIIDEGLPMEEVSIISQTVAETIPEGQRIEKSDPLIEQLKEFLISVMQEYNILFGEDIAEDLADKILAAHNSYSRVKN